MLRKYQQDIYDQIRHNLCLYDSVCAVLPCRSGKSYIMKEICEKAALKNSKVLILAHRRLLLRQHAKIIENVRFEGPLTEVRHLGEHGKVDLIIIDEAHIAGSESYQKICDYYKCKKILFTATAKRLDNKPLPCDYIINGVSADELINLGYVSNYDLYAPKLNIDLSNVKMSGADFNNEELAETMCDKKIYGDIIKYYKQLAEGKQALAYCVNIKHAKEVCKLFQNNGYAAAEMDNEMPEKCRDELLDKFKSGEIQILCNCNLISEGITLPECDCCLLLRPTQSETLYIQQACRCLTPRKNKKAVIIDYVGNCYTHGMPTEKREYTLNAHEKRIRNASREEDVIVRQCKKCLRVYAGNKPICPYCGFDNGKTRKQIEQDKQAELERITAIKKKQARQEVGMAKDLEALINIGIKRGYKNPSYWARQIMEARRKKRNGI